MKWFGISILALLTAVMILHFVLPDQSYSAAEKRALVQAPDPKPDFSALLDGSFMSQADTYVSDQFPLRTDWMRMRVTYGLLLGQSESQGVYYGRDGSLIQAFDGYDEALLENTVRVINDFVRKHDFANASLLLIPSALSVYPENLPPYVEAEAEMAYIRAFRERLEAGILMPEAMTPLLAMKEAGEKLYYMTDHHWTSPAAYGMYKFFAAQRGWEAVPFKGGVVSNNFSGALAAKSGFTPAGLDEIILYEAEVGDFQQLVIHAADGRISAGMYVAEALKGPDPYEVFLGGNEPLLQIRTTADTEDTLLIFKDSYANCFLPFLAAHYKSITVIDPRYYGDQIESLFLQSDFTDVLFLFSASGLAKDESLRVILEEEK